MLQVPKNEMDFHKKNFVSINGLRAIITWQKFSLHLGVILLYFR